MKTVTIGEFKANLSSYAEKIQKGEEFVVTHGRKRKKIFGYHVSWKRNFKGH